MISASGTSFQLTRISIRNHNPGDSNTWNKSEKGQFIFLKIYRQPCHVVLYVPYSSEEVCMPSFSFPVAHCDHRSREDLKIYHGKIPLSIRFNIYSLEILPVLSNRHVLVS